MMPVDPFHDRVIASATGVGQVQIGRGTYWNSGSLFMTYTAQETIVIGRYCSIADAVLVATGGEHKIELVSAYPFDAFFDGIGNPQSRSYRIRPNTEIGSDVWLCHGAYVLPGSKIGHGAIIGAGAVVSGEIPPYAIVVGNPGKAHRFRHPEHVREALLAIAWWEWTGQQVIDRRDDFYRPVEAFVEKYA